MDPNNGSQVYTDGKCCILLLIQLKINFTPGLLVTVVWDFLLCFVSTNLNT